MVTCNFKVQNIMVGDFIQFYLNKFKIFILFKGLFNHKCIHGLKNVFILI